MMLQAKHPISVACLTTAITLLDLSEQCHASLLFLHHSSLINHAMTAWHCKPDSQAVAILTSIFVEKSKKCLAVSHIDVL
jgi:hypothetical protein